ncbi:acid phosphatase-like protein [Diplodia corticola]|uniref:Acid phosphatase-like protein n=1 Tax=Diplodia corticola TaxID=236234 RepID=A0A1J9QLI8_9PEZI|nr:acid phosphatase-like protein [Diplodia corticola]OJD28930.1 acid phosphatase-like protein [Diplodia corticola]
MASGVGIFFGILILLIVIGGVSWVAYTRIRAKRLGLPPPPLNPFARGSRSSIGGAGALPAPAPSGFVGWVNDKISALKNKGGGRNNSRYAAGAYEEPGAARAGGRGRGTLDPDEAWDARVGTEADYGYGYDEEQELGGLHHQDHHSGTTPYGGSGYAGSGMYAAPHSAGLSAGSERGRSRTRELDERYDEEMGHSRGHGGGENPFGDSAERSNLRGVSPRPVGSGARGGAAGDSPTESRRSMFREEV